MRRVVRGRSARFWLGVALAGFAISLSLDIKATADNCAASGACVRSIVLCISVSCTPNSVLPCPDGTGTCQSYRRDVEISAPTCATFPGFCGTCSGETEYLGPCQLDFYKSTSCTTPCGSSPAGNGVSRCKPSFPYMECYVCGAG